jgi:nucleotide-binding universal stress UspA family protein
VGIRRQAHDPDVGSNKMYNHILVAVDGSDTSNRALQEAEKLAQEQHAALRIVSVVDLTLAYSDEAAPYVLDYQNAMQAHGDKVISDCSAIARAAGIEFDAKTVAIDKLGQHV